MTKSVVSSRLLRNFIFGLVLIVPTSALANDHDKDDLGGKLILVGGSGFGLPSACSSDSLQTGGVKVSVSVVADLDSHHEHVDVRISFKGNAHDSLARVYDIADIAHATYNTVNNVGFAYFLPVRLHVTGVGAAPSFTSLFELGVLVDANQKPIRVDIGLVGGTCNAV